VRRPVVSVLVAVGILGGTFVLVPRLHTNFLGDAGGDTLTVSQQLAPGTALPQADAAAKRVEGVLAATPGVGSYQVTVGSPEGASGLGAGQSSDITRFSVTPGREHQRHRGARRPAPPAGRVAVPSRSASWPCRVRAGHDALQVSVRAADPAVLAQAAAAVQQVVASIPGAADVRNNLAAAQPTVAVAADRRRRRRPAQGRAGGPDRGADRSVGGHRAARQQRRHPHHRRRRTGRGGARRCRPG
jgi:HAE1 family hydrophobic/amphiphilic exporter-1